MVVAPEGAIRTSFFKSSVKTCHFTDETVHFSDFVRKTIGFHGQTCLMKDDQEPPSELPRVSECKTS